MTTWPAQRRLQQQRPQIFSKHGQCLLFRFLGQRGPNFPLDGRRNEPLKSVFGRELQMLVRGRCACRRAAPAKRRWTTNERLYETM